MLLGKISDSCIEKWFRQLELSCDEPVNNLDMNNAAREERSRTLKKRKSMWEALYEQNKEGDNFLHMAVLDESIDSIDFLLKMAPHPCILDLQNDNEQTALHLSVLTNQRVIVKKLISAGANVSIPHINHFFWKNPKTKHKHSDLFIDINQRSEWQYSSTFGLHLQ